MAVKPPKNALLQQPGKRPSAKPRANNLATGPFRSGSVPAMERVVDVQPNPKFPASPKYPPQPARDITLKGKK